MGVQTTQTQAKILAVRGERGDGRFSIEAEVPVLGKYPTKFIQFNEVTTGQPCPSLNDEIVGTFEPTVRQKRFVDDGTFDSDGVDGSEMPWQVNWTLTAWKLVEPYGTIEGNGSAEKKALLSQGSTRVSKPVFIDANLRYRVDQTMINDRESIRMVIEHGKTADSDSIYTDVESVLAEAEKIAAWLNKRLEVRLGGGLVGALQEMGATVKKVVDVPKIKNSQQLKAWVGQKGWTKKEIQKVLTEFTGHGDSADFLAVEGNTPQGLAELLAANLDT